jgi:hypothetical protein
MIDFKEFIKLRDFLYRKTGIYIEDKRYELDLKKNLISFDKSSSNDRENNFNNTFGF